MKDSALDPRQPEVLARLSKVARSTVTYVRQMSGQAHVILVLPTPPTTYEDALQAIRDSGLVEFVELDAVMKAFPTQ